MTWPDDSYPVPSLLPHIKVTEEAGRLVFAARRSCSLLSAGCFPAGVANFIALSALCSRCVTRVGVGSAAWRKLRANPKRTL
jgi:hypothetical protein